MTDDWGGRWSRRSAEAPSDLRTAELIALLEKLVASDPLRALALARAETEAGARERFLAAILRVWATRDPSAAAAQALALPTADRAAAVAAVLQGAVCDPATAVRLAERLCRDDQARAREHGNALIAALEEAGDYRTAVRFATTADSSDGEDRLKWTQAAFGLWASREPERAVIATLELPDAGARYEALLAVVGDWVRVDPHGLTEFVLQLPAGADRANVLGEALQLWVHNNPKAAAEWMDRLEPSPELDAGVAALATLPQLVGQRPAVALSWAESIVNPEQRSNSVTAILRQWVATDPEAARAYAERSADLSSADRLVILAVLVPAAASGASP